MWGKPEYLYYDPIQSAAPVHRYEIYDTQKKAALAAEKLFSDLVVAMLGKEFFAYHPSERDVRILADATGADTICLLRVQVNSHQIVRDIDMGVGVAGRVFHPDATEYDFVFIDSETGEVLWQYALNRARNDLDPSLAVAEEALRFLPAKGEPMQGDRGADGLLKCK
ncbi:MAG: hypothetical protein ACF8NJ_00040 [Phycisphaerales bacterium JB038]